MSGPLHTVHVRVNDAATGEPTPVRLFVWGGVPDDHYVPFGRIDLPLSENPWGGTVLLYSFPHTYIDGTCEIELPAKPITVEIRKGFEYRPLIRQTTLGPGKLALRFTIERWIDLRPEGWYSGDTSVIWLTPHAALLEGAAEDVAVVNLLASEYDDGIKNPIPAVSNIVAFSGQRPCLEMPGHMVVVNTWNFGRVIGSLGLLNCHRVVYPLRTGYPLPYGESEEAVYHWTLDDWCDQCHRKAGLVLWNGFGRTESGQLADAFGGEALAMAILTKIDALELDHLDWMQTQEKNEWYRLLQVGTRLPLTGGSYKLSGDSVVGSLRTYARLRPGEDFNYKNWIEAVRAGRTFVTNGPLLTFTVNDLDPGAVIDLPADAPRKVRINAEARSIVPFERLELIVNGDAMACVEASGDPTSALLEGEFEVPGTCWIAARCWGNSPAFAASSPDDHAAAHTSPVYVQVQGQPFPVDMISLALLIERLDKMLTWVDTEARFDGERTRNHLTEVLQNARAELVRRGETAR